MSNRFASLVFIVGAVFAPWIARAQEQSLDLSVEVSTATKEPGVARRELLDAAARKGVEEFLKSEFGDETVARNRAAVEGKILKEFSKFVPSSKHVEFRETPDGFKSTVLVKLNRTDLVRQGFAAGLRRPMELEPIVLPLWTWIDGVKLVQSNWWLPSNTPEALWLASTSQGWESFAAPAFEKQGLQFLRPQQLKYATAVPEAHRKAALGAEDVDALAKHWKAPMVLEGFVKTAPVAGRTDVFRIDVDWKVKFMRNGREVGEIKRSFETDAGPYETVVDRKLREIRDGLVQDLAEQVGETRRRNALQAEVMEFEINGDLQPAQKEMLRRQLAGKYRSIKGVRERLISGKRLLFEVDVSPPVENAARELSDVSFDTWSVRLESQSAGRFIFRVVSKKENAP